MPDHPTAHPKMATCTHPDKRKAAQAQKRRSSRFTDFPLAQQHPFGCIGQGIGQAGTKVRPLCWWFQHLCQVKEGSQKSGQRDLPFPKGRAQIAHKQGRPSTGVRRGRTKCSGTRWPSNFELLGHAFVPVYQKGVKAKYQLVVKKSSWESRTVLWEVRGETPLTYSTLIFQNYSLR